MVEKKIYFIRMWLKVKSNINDPLDLDERKTFSGQNDGPPPSYVGTWTELHERVRAKIKP